MRPEGLYCPAGDFYIDPWRPVARAVITHAHSDHGRPGMAAYWCSSTTEPLLRQRVGRESRIQGHPFGESFALGRALISLHPAGHVLGSAQIRIEVGSRVAVVTGDHNASHIHGAAEPYEPVPCDLFITESTFGLPIYRWQPWQQTLAEIHDWWRLNRAAGRTSILPCYPLGKTQRILAALDPAAGPIGVNGAALPMLEHYHRAGVALPEVIDDVPGNLDTLRGRGLVLVSFAAREPAWLRKLQPLSFGTASGWMQVRGNRHQAGADRGFVLSDHSDWEGILQAVKASGARRVGVTHGQVHALSRYLRECADLEAFVVPTHFESGGN